MAGRRLERRNLTVGSPVKSPKPSAAEPGRVAKPSMCILRGEKGVDGQRSGNLKSSCVLLREGLASSMWDGGQGRFGRHRMVRKEMDRL